VGLVAALVVIGVVIAAIFGAAAFMTEKVVEESSYSVEDGHRLVLVGSKHADRANRVIGPGEHELVGYGYTRAITVALGPNTSTLFVQVPESLLRMALTQDGVQMTHLEVDVTYELTAQNTERLFDVPGGDYESLRLEPLLQQCFPKAKKKAKGRLARMADTVRLVTGGEESGVDLGKLSEHLLAEFASQARNRYDLEVTGLVVRELVDRDSDAIAAFVSTRRAA